MNLNYKKIDVIGLGRANTEMVFMLKNKGYNIVLHDKNIPNEKLLNRIKEANIETYFGENYLENLDGDLIIRTPGMYFKHPALIKKNVTTEIGLFIEHCPCKTIGITGSDGKTTTTSLIADILKNEGYRVHIGGNIGLPMLYNINNIQKDDFAVVELSSFQLADMKVSPNIAVVTNISPNHLDVHHTMEEYFSCKANILKYQKENDMAILGPDSFLPFVKGSLRKFNESKLPFDKEEIKLAGEHNYQNMLAAYNAVKDFVSKEAVLKTAKTFSGVEHRLEFVKEVAGVSFYNDSIATTPTRTMAGLKSFPKKVILIAGGYDKLIPFNPMKEVLNEKVKTLILIGNTAKKIGSLYDGKDIFYMDSLENAVKKAKEIAISGDVVLMSPACASFDMFKDFETRGEVFKELVKAL